MDSRIKRDPVTYVLLLAIVGLQLYSTLLRPRADAVIAESDRAYEAAVFNGGDNKGVMHQIFRQNEVDRELLKVVLKACAR